MRSFRRFLRAAVVILVAAAILVTLDFLLYPCTFVRSDVHAVTTRTFDDLYLGTSHGKSNISPAAAEEVSGRSGYNMCVGGEYAVDAYYLAKLVLEKGHRPQRIIYEVSPAYLSREKEEGNNYLLFFHEFPLSLSRAEYFFRTVAGCNLRTLFFPWYEYPLSYELEHIGETVTRKASGDYSTESMRTGQQEYHDDGFLERYPMDPETFSFQGLQELFPEDLREDNMAWLDRLTGLCRDNGIEMVAVVTPLPGDTLDRFRDGYLALDEYFAGYFAERNIRYINFNSGVYAGLAEYGIEDYTDLDGHMNGDAARRFSRLLAGVLETDEAGAGELFETEEEDSLG